MPGYTPQRADFDYIQQISQTAPQILQDLRDETSQLPHGGMQVSIEQGRFLALMVGLTGARRCIEVGTFTGASSLAVALALPADGTILCCDISDDYTAVARRYWQRAGVADKITLEIGPAVETLRAKISGGEAASYDLAFIDADKTNYDNYYELCLELLRPGGVVMVDNVLWHGAAADPEADTPDANAIKALNAKIGVDDRVEAVLLPIGDGHMVCRKRP